MTAMALALSACAEAPRPSTGAAPASAAAPAATEGAAALERALREALARRAWSDLRIDTECQTDAGLRSATVFNSGVGIWNGERQFTLPRERVLDLLREFEAVRFAGLRDTYGEGRPPKNMALELVCRVRLELDGAAKQVHQLTRGPWSPELKQLAERLLKAAEEAGRSGPGASSLTDGLEKISRGALAPELLVLSVLRQGEGGAAMGWELVLEGGKAVLQRSPVEDGEAAHAVRLAPAEVTGIAGQLAAARIEELPVNLWAPEYTDLEVRVLKHRRSLQARQFAGMTPDTHGELQQRFDRLWEAIEDLRGRLAAPLP
jgi:hypothetical protein